GSLAQGGAFLNSFFKRRDELITYCYYPPLFVSLLCRPPVGRVFSRWNGSRTRSATHGGVNWKALPVGREAAHSTGGFLSGTAPISGSAIQRPILMRSSCAHPSRSGTMKYGVRLIFLNFHCPLCLTYSSS